MKAVSQNTHKAEGNTNSTILTYLTMIIKLVSTKVDQRLPITRSTHPWKCEKCDRLFVTLKELRQHKEEYHSY
jgi:hypothetical protein